jgi:hypothetical protein
MDPRKSDRIAQIVACSARFLPLVLPSLLVSILGIGVSVRWNRNCGTNSFRGRNTSSGFRSNASRESYSKRLQRNMVVAAEMSSCRCANALEQIERIRGREGLDFVVKLVRTRKVIWHRSLLQKRSFLRSVKLSLRLHGENPEIGELLRQYPAAGRGGNYPWSPRRRGTPRARSTDPGLLTASSFSFGFPSSPLNGDLITPAWWSITSTLVLLDPPSVDYCANPPSAAGAPHRALTSGRRLPDMKIVPVELAAQSKTKADPDI